MNFYNSDAKHEIFMTYFIERRKLINVNRSQVSVKMLTTTNDSNGLGKITSPQIYLIAFR